MNTDLAWLALTYGGMLLAGLVVWLARFEARDGHRAGRAAWCAAWLAATAGYLVHRGHRSPSVELAEAVAPAAWTVVAALVSRLSRRPAPSVAPWLATVATVAAFAWWLRGPVVGATVAAAIALGGLVDRAMERRRWLAFRLIAYWTSFVGTFAVLIPVAVSARAGTPQFLPLGIGLPLAGVFVMIGTLMAWAGTRAFAGAGGTPEPLDAPTRLCQTGIYGRLRHPIQVAEILFVAAGAAAVGTRSALVFCVAFTAALVGPLRVFEERRLAEYRRRCPAFLPRRTKVAAASFAAAIAK